MAQQIRLRVTGMHCASCVGRVEKILQAHPSVSHAAVNLASGTAQMDSNAPAQVIAEALTKGGYAAEVLLDPMQRVDVDAGQIWRKFWIAAALTLPVFILEMGGHAFPAFHHWVHANIGLGLSWSLQALFITTVLFWPGLQFFTAGFASLARRAPDMNALVALGAGASWAYSLVVLLLPSLVPQASRAVYFEAAGVIVTLILLGRALEARAKGQAGAAIRALVDLQPETAPVWRDGDWAEAPLSEVRIGDRLLARPGSRIAVDGHVTSGQGYVEEAMLTGEPIPVLKSPGAAVSAGTLAQNTALEYEASAVGADTNLARIVQMVERAQGAKLPVQAMIDRVTSVFVPVVMTLAVLSCLGWLLAGGTLAQALVALVSVLIIACPCAMGLATPVSIVVASGRAAQMGALLRQGAALEHLARVQSIAFDKTGTLTTGQLSLAHSYGETAEALKLAASIEAQSEHPIARALCAAYTGTLLEVEGVEAIPGHGLRGQIGGDEILIGAPRLFTEQGMSLSGLTQALQDIQSAAATPVIVARSGRVLAAFGLSDTIRAEAKAMIQSLKQAGFEPVLISGDQAPVANHVAKELGIEMVHAEVLPADKRAVVEQLQATGPVAFVGDGINDAPALAQAEVGIAIGTGTDVAIETADVVLQTHDLSVLPKLLKLARATRANIRQNLFWAFGYNAALIPVAMGLFYPAFGWQLSPMLGAGAMALSSVFVVTNALRLRRGT